MEQLTTILSSLGGAVLVIFFLRMWVGQLREDVGSIKKRMDCFEASQHACQLDNAKVFATKDDFRTIETRVTNHEGRIIKIESRG